MNALDIVVLALVGVLGALGFKRGFIAEAGTLAAWVAAVLMVNLLFAPVSAAIEPKIGSTSGAAALAVVGLFLVTLIAGKLLASRLGKASRASVLGPVDRLLGLGFGVVKALVAASLLFLLATLAVDLVYGPDDRPTWMREARTYPILRASSAGIVELVRERQGRGDERTLQR